MITVNAERQLDDVEEAIVDRALDCVMSQIEQEAVPFALLELGAAVESQLTSTIRNPVRAHPTGLVTGLDSVIHR